MKFTPHITYRNVVAVLCVATSVCILGGWKYPFVPNGWMCATRPMAPASAICFLLIGLERLSPGHQTDVVTSAGILSVLINIILDTALKPHEHSYTIIVDKPCVLTSIGFLVFCAGNLLGYSGLKTKFVGGIIVFLGGIVLVGYGIGNDVLTGVVQGRSGPMAIHSAVLFILIGITQIRSRFVDEALK